MRANLRLPVCDVVCVCDYVKDGDWMLDRRRVRALLFYNKRRSAIKYPMTGAVGGGVTDDVGAGDAADIS